MWGIQVVGKSAKPIPVMILGVLIGRRSYPVMKYVFVVVIVTGVVLFMLKEGGAGAAGKDDSNWIGLGELLIALSLTMDGLTGAVQERMRAEYSPTAQHMMLFMNKWSAVFLLAALAGTGEGWHFLKFIGRHPVCLSHIAQLAVAGALGQLCIFLTVSEFGPLPCSIVTTTRKFFTVLASVALFGNVLTPRQWLGAATVFTGLFLDVYFSKASAKNK